VSCLIHHSPFNPAPGAVKWLNFPSPMTEFQQLQVLQRFEHSLSALIIDLAGGLMFLFAGEERTHECPAGEMDSFSPRHKSSLVSGFFAKAKCQF
jgi:hypothetical protein